MVSAVRLTLFSFHAVLSVCLSVCLSTRRELSTENSPGQGGRRLLLLCAHAGARAGEPALARGGEGRADRVQTDVLAGLRLARAERSGVLRARSAFLAFARESSNFFSFSGEPPNEGFFLLP